jgi:vacuolar-type H+-ATPase subunit F/Vma7
MAKILAMGSNEFAVGFQLAGIATLEVDQSNIAESVKSLMSAGETGIVILHQKTADLMLPELKEKVLQSINPVFVVLSRQESSEELRMLIKKSIGVDLWNR